MDRKAGTHTAVRSILAGCGAALLGWAGFLYFFTSKDNPYELGWFFWLVGLAGVCVATALCALVTIRIIRVKGEFTFSAPVIVMLACPFMPLLGWTGALGMVYTDATPGSVFMLWAFTFSICGFLAPPVTAALVHFRKSEAAKAEESLDKHAPSHPVAVYVVVGVLCLIAAVLFALSGDYRHNRFFSMLFVLISVTAAVSLPALLMIIISFRRKARRLIPALALWIAGTALLLGLLLSFYILYELIHGLMHFRL